ncbi:hypothetical protein RP20_CCG015298 [Aedes albopictus]|nr:hypothetical protein RP20_CCG015298 [Aedes albopictus]
MFAVIQFIENTKFQVLAVPVSWIKNGNLLWPKLSNEKIEHLRVSGAEHHGAFKRIPVIITKKFRNFEAAEKAADDLAKRDVSDVEEKRKKLKPQKKPPLKKPKDYNAMLSEHSTERNDDAKTINQTFDGTVAIVTIRRHEASSYGFGSSSAISNGPNICRKRIQVGPRITIEASNNPSTIFTTITGAATIDTWPNIRKCTPCCVNIEDPSSAHCATQFLGASLSDASDITTTVYEFCSSSNQRSDYR